jgi:hypothetical protein
MQTTFAVPLPATANILTIQSQSKEVIKIAPDGALFWHGREVETDDDFKAAMLDLAKHLSGGTH